MGVPDCYSPVPFPEYLGVITQENFNSALVIQKGYLGAKWAQTTSDTLSFTFEISHLANQEEFIKWWTSDLDYGKRYFSLNIRTYGEFRNEYVVMLNDLSETRTCINGISVPVQLEVYHD